MNRLGWIAAGGLLALATILMSETYRPAPTQTKPVQTKPAQTKLAPVQTKSAPVQARRAKPATAKKRPAAASAKAAIAASIERGKQVYLAQCLACHQADALGVENMNPPLVKSKRVLGDKTSLVQVVLKGMQGVDIGDESYHNVMAPHSDLSDQQIADVLTYIRNNFGNKASAVKAGEVKAIRAKTK